MPDTPEAFSPQRSQIFSELGGMHRSMYGGRRFSKREPPPAVNTSNQDLTFIMNQVLGTTTESSTIIQERTIDAIKNHEFIPIQEVVPPLLEMVNDYNIDP